MSKMEIITSNKGGFKLCFKGYMYTKQHLCKTKIWWRCVKKSSVRCRASLTTTVNHKRPTVVKPHNHAADESQVQKAKLRSLKRQVAQTNRRTAAPVVAPPVVAPPVVEPPAEIPSPNINNNLEPDLSYNPAPIITSPPIVKIENVKSEPRGTAATDLDMQQLISATEHSHERDYNKVEAAKVRNIIKTAALSNTSSTSNIVSEAIDQQPPEVRSAVGKIDSIKRHVRRLQNKAMREKADEIVNRHGIMGPFADQSFTISPAVLSMKFEEDAQVEPMRSSDEKNHLFLIDTDPGLDDAQAILMALAVDSVNVLALTTVQGNSPSYCSCLNALRLLKAADRLDIPVFPGCERPMISEPLHAGLYHGTDGFGDVPDRDAPGLDMAQSEHAVNSLIRLTREHPGEITLVALGPLTNIAMAIRMEPSLGTRLKNCFIMGGNYRGVGNITRSAEFNFANDPEAAQIVLTELKCPITLCTWELCTDMQQPLALWEKLMSMPGKKAAFMKKIQSIVKSRLEISGCYIMCDELAMAAAIDERTILESQDVFAEVETHGKIARGQLISDWRNLMAKPENVRIVTKMDMDRVEELLVNSFNS